MILSDDMQGFLRYFQGSVCTRIERKHHNKREDKRQSDNCSKQMELPLCLMNKHCAVNTDIFRILKGLCPQ
jgi:hypothetical protein